MVSSAYCCNLIDAEPKERPLIEDKELIFLDKTSVDMENRSILSGQPCCMPAAIEMRSVRVCLTFFFLWIFGNVWSLWDGSGSSIES